MQKREKIIFTALSDLGKLRTENEDMYICQPIWNEETYLFCVIDGVGGYEGGKQAAGITRDSILNYLSVIRNGEREQLLREVLVAANNKIIEAKTDIPRLRNMSCVVSCCIVDMLKWKLSYAHVGDTRIYEFRQGALKKISHDHSLVGYREEAGELTEEEAMKHPQRNIIARELGMKIRSTDTDDFIESGTLDLYPDTLLLLCSDGLTDMITSRSVAGILNETEPIENKARNMVAAANDAGGSDNITVLLAHFLPPADGDMDAESHDHAEPVVNNDLIHRPENEDQPIVENKTEDIQARTTDRTPDADMITTDTATLPETQAPGKNTGKAFLRNQLYPVFIAIAILLLFADMAVHLLKKDQPGNPRNIYISPPSGSLQQRLEAAAPRDTLADLYEGDTLLIASPLLMNKDSIVWMQSKPLFIKPAQRFNPEWPAIIIVATGVQLKNIRFTGFETNIWPMGNTYKIDGDSTTGKMNLSSAKETMSRQ